MGQYLSKKLRRLIRINGERTLGYDYRATHTNLAYCNSQLQLEGDPYSIPGYARETVKRVMMRCFNVSSPARAIQAVSAHWEKDKTGRLRYKDGLPRETAVDLVRVIGERHPKISNWIFKNCGLELMYQDAHIAKDVIMHFVNQGIPCLSIHDCFIVPKRYADELRQVMLDTWQKVTGFTVELKRE